MFGNEAPVTTPRDQSATAKDEHDLISAREVRRLCAPRLRAALGRLGIAISIAALGATSPAPPVIRHDAGAAPRLHGQDRGNHCRCQRPGQPVTAYGASASGDARPTATLSLGLDIPDCATFDAAGNLLVVNYSGRSVVEYAGNAFSGARPARADHLV